mmetsp:Transcript_47817/g.125221  ORF Transcript_47817/g.125221 Transcript_47817/m.125221 type:complete len:273 (+) Transcript_47817:1110-1928(+)
MMAPRGTRPARRTVVVVSSSAFEYSRRGKGTRSTNGPASTGRRSATAAATWLSGSPARSVRRSTVPSSQRTRTSAGSVGSVGAPSRDASRATSGGIAPPATPPSSPAVPIDNEASAAVMPAAAAAVAAAASASPFTATSVRARSSRSSARRALIAAFSFSFRALSCAIAAARACRSFSSNASPAPPPTVGRRTMESSTVHPRPGVRGGGGSSPATERPCTLAMRCETVSLPCFLLLGGPMVVPPAAGDLLPVTLPAGPKRLLAASAASRARR